MPYAILRFKKRKAGSIASCERHNERKKEAYKSNPDIDISKSKDNYYLIKPHNYTYKQEIKKLIKEANCKVRKDSTMLVETLITASPEFMKNLSSEEQKEYFTIATEFLIDKIGKKNIISAVVHMDETTPHMHLVFCPITKDNKLSAKTFLGNQKTLSNWQTEYHNVMSKRWECLERGQSSMETKRKHIPTWLFKLGGKLDKQYDEIVKTLEDISIFNVSKTRDKAIKQLSKWLPEVERFSNEVAKSKQYISSLEQKVSNEKSATSYLKKELDKKEIEIFGKSCDIEELEYQVRKQQKILDKIPIEILEKIQNERGVKNGRENR